MEEVVIPPGKQLRYRCNVEGCQKNKSFSMISIMDHVASHFSQQRGSDLVFNYHCKLCGIRFFLEGMCLGCKCNARDGGEQFISLKHGITLEDVRREASFFEFVNKWVVPVFDDVPDAPSAAATVNVETTVDTDEIELCKCNARDGGEQFISLKHGITLEDVRREASFFEFVNKWVVPVFDDVPDAPSAAATVNVETTVDTDEIELCKCNARDGGEQFISLKHGITLEDVRREASFFEFVNKWVVPVFDDIPGAPPAAATVTVQTTVDTDEIEVIEEHGPALEEQLSLPKKIIRPRTPYPTTSAPIALGPTPHLPKNAFRNPAEKSRFFTHEGHIQMENCEGEFRTVSHTPLPYAQIDADKEGLQLPAYHPAAMGKSSNTSAMDIVEDGQSEDGGSSTWSLCAEVSESPAPSTTPTVQPSPSGDILQQQKHLQRTEGAAEEQPCSLVWGPAPDTAPNGTPYVTCTTHGAQAPSSPPSAQITVPFSENQRSANSDHARPLIPPPPPPPPPLDAKEPSSQSESEHSQSTAQSDKKKRRLATTARLFNKKSRQDGLLEENSSPPRFPRRLSSPAFRASEISFSKQSGPKTPPYELHVSSDFHTFGPDKQEETSALPVPNSAVPHKTSLVQAPPLGIPLPAPQALAAVSPTLFKEDKNNVVEVEQRKGVENGRNGSVGMGQLNNRSSAAPSPVLPPFLPPPFPPPPYLCMDPFGQYQPFPPPFPMYNRYGPVPPPQYGMSYTAPPGYVVPPPGVPPPRLITMPTLSAPPPALPTPALPALLPPALPPATKMLPPLP